MGTISKSRKNERSCLYAELRFHRSDVLSMVNLAVNMLLTREKITGEQLKFLTNAIGEQAKEQYKEWPKEPSLNGNNLRVH